jgi:hypothetical protein
VTWNSSVHLLETKINFWHFFKFASYQSKAQSKVIPVIGRGGLVDFETSMIPHFLDNPIIDGSEFVSLTSRSWFYSQEDSWYSFLLDAWKPQGHSAAGSIW